MENGFGGFMIDLKFYGGGLGVVFGFQQFMVWNFEFNDCRVVILQFWNWIWNFYGIKVNNCDVGFDFILGGKEQFVGFVIVQDGMFMNMGVGFLIVYNIEQKGINGILIIDNINFVNIFVVVCNLGIGENVLSGNKMVILFV